MKYLRYACAVASKAVIRYGNGLGKKVLLDEYQTIKCCDT